MSSIEKTVEKIFDLPPGSVQIHKPSGRNARDDKSIESLRKEYNPDQE